MAAIPPGPEIKRRIEKTAPAVAKNPGISASLLASEKKDKFSFLLETDPFYPYFLFQLQLAKAGNAEPQNQEPQQQRNVTVPASTALDQLPTPSLPHDVHPAEGVGSSVDPHPETYSLHPVAGVEEVSQLDRSLILLTAQSELRYDEQFMNKVRSERSLPLDFLNPSHPLNGLYQQAVKAYWAVGNAASNAQNTLEKLDLLATDKDYVMRSFQDSAQFLRSKRLEEKRASLSESVLFGRLEWSRFQVVGSFSREELGLASAQHPSSSGTIPIREDYLPGTQAVERRAATTLAPTPHFQSDGRRQEHDLRKRVREEDGLATESERVQNFSRQYLQ